MHYFLKYNTTVFCFVCFNGVIKCQWWKERRELKEHQSKLSAFCLVIPSGPLKWKLLGGEWWKPPSCNRPAKPAEKVTPSHPRLSYQSATRPADSAPASCSGKIKKDSTLKVQLRMLKKRRWASRSKTDYLYVHTSFQRNWSALNTNVIFWGQNNCELKLVNVSKWLEHVLME